MPRLFTAVELGPGARAAIASRQSELARSLRGSGDAGLRLVRSEQLHLTLVFIGDVEDTRLPAITAAMTADIALPPFDIEFASCGVFPPRGPARVLWLGVGRGAQDLVRLFELVSARLEDVGIPRERRPFEPHLTLGRWRDRGGSSTRPKLPELGPVTVQRVSAVTLFQSQLLPGGSAHTPLVHADLSGAVTSLH